MERWRDGERKFRTDRRKSEVNRTGAKFDGMRRGRYCTSEQGPGRNGSLLSRSTVGGRDRGWIIPSTDDRKTAVYQVEEEVEALW